MGLEPSGKRAQPGQARQQFMPSIELVKLDPFGHVISARLVVEQREMDVVTRAPRLRPAEQGREHALGAAARERVDREQYPLSVQHVSSLEFDAQIRFGRTLTTPICCSAHSAARDRKNTSLNSSH